MQPTMAEMFTGLIYSQTTCWHYKNLYFFLELEFIQNKKNTIENQYSIVLFDILFVELRYSENIIKTDD